MLLRERLDGELDEIGWPRPVRRHDFDVVLIHLGFTVDDRKRFKCARIMVCLLLWIEEHQRGIEFKRLFVDLKDMRPVGMNVEANKNEIL